MDYRFAFVETMDDGLPDCDRLAVLVPIERVGNDIDIVGELIEFLETEIDRLVS